MGLNVSYCHVSVHTCASLVCRSAVHIAVLYEDVMMMMMMMWCRFTVSPGVPALTDAYGFALPITPA